MTRAPTLAWVSDRWRGLTAFGAVVVSLVTAAIHPPPIGEARSYIAFGGFAAAVTSGLIYVLMRARASKVDTRLWWIAACASMAACLIVNLTYASMWDRHVGTYAGVRQVVGSTLTDVGRRWIDTRGASSPSDLLFAAAGQADVMWTSDSIARTRRNFRLAYYACYPLFALSILTTVQALHCSAGRSPRRRQWTTRTLM